MTSHCPHCGWPDAQPFQLVSRHRTHAGETVWTRCSCGSLQVRVRDANGTRITARSRPVAATPTPRVQPATVPDAGPPPEAGPLPDTETDANPDTGTGTGTDPAPCGAR